ncbi:glycosyltransferase family 4 protein [Psychrobacter sp. TAE2020]|uniref:glycosyltransferase n=1 Tax=Psychrobacter sp. TAE2020 TaxID=2846762 RepID=UPI001C102306|nr:glycosyltransferase [Psychrobacter sp. TAE2020]MBU5616451.1 glycosyltransferase family 4 protein [Psychrobacter sp. TAE2020]
MKVLFVHDHKFKVDNNVYYSSGSFSADIWQRYLSVFKFLTVVGRDDGKITNNHNKYSISSASGVDFVLLPNISNFKNEVLGNNFVREKCKKLVASNDALIARLPSKLGTLFIKEAIRQNKPYAIEVVGNAWDALWSYGSLKGKLYAPIMEMNTKKVIYNAPFVIYVTEYFLQKRYPCKNGETEFCSDAEVNEVSNDVLTQRLSRINSHSSKTTFGLIGHYSADYKGIDVAIKALAHISPYLKNWEFQIVGSGDPTKYIELAKKLKVINNIRFIGRLPSGKPIYDWLDSIDVYLQPSLVEGLPRALVEAMSRGCPSLGSTIGGIPELLNEAQVSKPGNHIDLSQDIFTTVNDKDLMFKLANDNFNKASSYYKSQLTERRTEFWISFYDYILEHKNIIKI